MRSHRVRTRTQHQPKIPRIPHKEAEKILEQCERFLEQTHGLLQGLREIGLGTFLQKIEEPVLLLALQPDSWGERARARLISDLAPALTQSSEQRSVTSIEQIARISNIVMPCLMLELGRRRQHVQVEFPIVPMDENARFRVSVGPSHPIHSLTEEQLRGVVGKLGESLVGLCYFGDHESRIQIEVELSLKTLPAA